VDRGDPVEVSRPQEPQPDRPESNRSEPLKGPIPWIVAWRFLRHRRSRLLNGTARAALAATTLGVMAMVIAMALMTGYREDLEAKLLSGNAAVLAYPLGPIGSKDSTPLPDRAALDRLTKIPGVERASRVAYGQGTLSGPAAPAASGAPGASGAKTEDSQVEVTLRGVEPGGGLLSGTAEQLGNGSDGIPGAVLGVELARTLGASAGDVLRLVVLGFTGGEPRFRYASVRMTGTFESGFAEFDRSWVAMDRAEVRRLTGGGDGGGGGDGATDLVEIAVEPSAKVSEVVASAQDILGSDYLVTDTRELNKPLFTALALQQTMLFLVLGLIVWVATFNTASTLVVLVRERMRDIGVLATLGVAPSGLRRIFLLYGGLLGGAGTLLGVALGWSVSWTITTFHLIRFDPDVAAIYFLSSVSFRVEPLDLAAVVAFTLGITLAACAVPAWFAARVDPSSALRYE